MNEEDGEGVRRKCERVVMEDGRLKRAIDEGGFEDDQV